MAAGEGVAPGAKQLRLFPGHRGLAKGCGPGGMKSGLYFANLASIHPFLLSHVPFH